MAPPNVKAVVLPTLLLCLLTVSELNFAPFLAAQSEPKVEGRQQGPLQSVLISDNTTLLSANRTFELGFFSLDGGSTWYAGIWYASISIRTYVWVANSETPVIIRNTSSSSSPALSRLGMEMGLTSEGRLAIVEGGGRRVRWTSRNSGRAASAELLETGNLVLVSAGGTTVWQSFDFPGNTWLPDMKITPAKRITSWRSSSDPAPGNYSLRLRPPLFGEFELVYGDGAASYWSTGNWTGDSFANVPEMTVPYIYTFRFNRPFTPAASFTFSESSAGGRILTRFAVDPAGMLRQYVWSPQTQYWLMFWNRPESPCSVYALCGELGFCQSSGQGDLARCQCLPGFAPADSAAWARSDFSSGCRRSDGAAGCGPDDRFRSVGVVAFTGAVAVSLRGASRASCEAACLSNCSCWGVSYTSRPNATCQHHYGRLLNLRNLTGETASDPESHVLWLRVGKDGVVVGDGKKGRVVKWREAVVVGCAVATLAIAGAISALALRWCRVGRKKKEGSNGKMGGGGKRGSTPDDDDIFSALQLTVFSYKDLTTATRGFSEKLGHGGFGGVFLGELPSGAKVAVKRLERPGGAGEREFRAEVCTIGSVQHVNLVRLRGFCCERAHRLLVYEYHPNGPLSAYLGGPSSRPPISWEARFRIALGTARGLAYLHEECRQCIIHCDIKPENILLGLDYGPKVSDFGLAKLLGRDFSRVAATMRGTWGYVAPEWISGTAITAKADVYSYGMTLLEIIGGRRNVEGGPEGDRWFFPPWAAKEIVEGRVEVVVDARLCGSYDRVEVARAGLAAVWCIQDDEAARPSMGTVVKMLQGTVEIAVPPPPVLLQALVAEDSFRGRGGPVSGLSEMRSNGSLPESRLSSSF